MTLESEFIELIEFNGVERIPRPKISEQISELRKKANTPGDPHSQSSQTHLDFIEMHLDTVEKQEAYSAMLLGEFDNEFLHDATGRLHLSLDLVLGVLDKLQIKIPHKIHFETYPTDNFNAVAIGARSGVFCLLNHGTTRLVHAISTAISTVLEEGNQLDDEVNMLMIGSLSSSVVDYIENRHIANVVLAEIPETPRQIDFANSLTVAMKSFIVAHELGHAVLGHVQPNKNWTPSDVGKLAYLDHNAGNAKHECEFEADAFAQRALNELPPLFSHGGIFTFYSLLFIKIIAAKIDGYEFSPNDESASHPATLHRLSKLKRLIGKYDDGVSSMVATRFDRAFKDLQQIDIYSGGDSIEIDLKNLSR